jgi:VanZ family protein
MEPQPNPDDAKEKSLPVWARLGVVACWLAIGYFASTARFSGEHTRPLLARVVRAVGLPDGLIDVLNLALRKTAHLCEYAGLAAIVVWVIAGVRSAGVRRNWFWIALAAVALAGALDEFHQSFEPGRDSSLRDVLIDVCGGLLLLVPLAVWRRKQTMKDEG